MTLSLDMIETAAWQAVSTATRTPGHPFRYMALGSIDQAGQPQSRHIVVRSVIQDLRLIDIHTDCRSPKWRQFAENPNANLLGFCPDSKTQLRMNGRVFLIAPTNPLTESIWQTLPPWTRKTYDGGPPGDELAFATEGEPTLGETETPDLAEGAGRSVFGLIRFQARSLDWVKLERETNKRALFHYAATGSKVSAAWIAP